LAPCVNPGKSRSFDKKNDCMAKTTQPTKPEQDTALAETTRRPLVRAEVIAKALDVHKRTVALWAQNGTIPCVRIGGAIRFDLEAVLGAAR
jgi:excisionase family DNA binding protein